MLYYIIDLSRLRMAWFSNYVMYYYFLDHRTIGIFSSTYAISDKSGKIPVVFLIFYKVNIRKYLDIVNTKEDNYIFQIASVARLFISISKLLASPNVLVFYTISKIVFP